MYVVISEEALVLYKKNRVIREDFPKNEDEWDLTFRAYREIAKNRGYKGDLPVYPETSHL